MKNLIIVLPFNNLDILEQTIRKHKDEVAAVILEPICYNAGCIVPEDKYIKGMRELTRENKILLIFDEVLSAFRMGLGGAQEYLGVTPDLCTIGKAVAGGLPLSVFAGSKEIMEHLRPLGDCEHSGTYNGHLIPAMAGLATLEEISSPGFYTHINELGGKLYAGLTDILQRLKIKARVQGLGDRFGIHFGIDEEVRDYRTAAKSNQETTLRFFRAMRERGVYFIMSNHHGFSSAHSLDDVEDVLGRAESALKEVRS